MSDYQTFDLGRVLQTAEAIKGARQEATFNNLRQQYMGQQIAQGAQSQKIQQVEFDQKQQETDARKQYYLSQTLLHAPDPKAAAADAFPDFVQKFDETHGQGAWNSLSPDQAHQIANGIMQHATSIIGPQTKVKWLDVGNQQIATDELTGQPIAGISPITKGASPDAELSAKTSTGNARLQANTSLATNAATNAASRANNENTVTATMRGQDMTAETARTTQGSKVTETQGNAKAFGLRATEANKTLEQMIAPTSQGGAGYNPTGIWAAKDLAAAGPVLTNWAASDAGQKYQNSAKAFIAPILRKESGAAISDGEWQQAKQLYIPWPGDGPDVLAQKTANRANAIQGLAVQAGPGGLPAASGATGQWHVEEVK